jgi:hypothetical protein
MFFYQPNLARQTTTEIITYFFGMIYSGQGYAVRIFCDVVCGEFLFWFMDYCLIIIVYINLGGQFFNKTCLVEKLGLFLHLGLWLIVLIGFWLGVCG